MSQDHAFMISDTLIQSIEDAILMGHVKELDVILDMVEDDVDFPSGLRHGLQALRYFREHYGKGGELEPVERLQKQKVVVMETAWGAELLDQLRQETEKGALRRA